MGTWQHGRAGEPVLLQVTLGTAMRELPRGDPWRTQDEWEAEEEACAGLDNKERRWVHYLTYGEDNTAHSGVQASSVESLARGTRDTRHTTPTRCGAPHPGPRPACCRRHRPRTRPTTPRSGCPAYGSSARWLRPEARRDTRKIRTFSQTTNPSPESVTRRYEGERVTLELRAEAPRKRWHRRRAGRREEHACSARWQLGARGAPSLCSAHSRR